MNYNIRIIFNNCMLKNFLLRNVWKKKTVQFSVSTTRENSQNRGICYILQSSCTKSSNTRPDRKSTSLGVISNDDNVLRVNSLTLANGSHIYIVYINCPAQVVCTASLSPNEERDLKIDCHGGVRLYFFIRKFASITSMDDPRITILVSILMLSMLFNIYM